MMLETSSSQFPQAEPLVHLLHFATTCKHLFDVPPCTLLCSSMSLLLLWRALLATSRTTLVPYGLPKAAVHTELFPVVLHHEIPAPLIFNVGDTMWKDIRISGNALINGSTFSCLAFCCADIVPWFMYWEELQVSMAWEGAIK